MTLPSASHSLITFPNHSATSHSSAFQCTHRTNDRCFPISNLLSHSPFTCQPLRCIPLRACRFGAIACRASMDLGQALPSSPPSPDAQLSSASGITWAQIALQGPRSEMEDSVVVRLDGFNGYNYAAVLDGHAGFSSVKYLRDALYKECATASENGLLLDSNDDSIVEDVLKKAFLEADSRLLSWLEDTGEDFESGSTATIMFLKSNRVIVAHVGDSRAVISRLGKAEVLCGDHRPYGKSKTSMEEIKRIRQAGGWINNGRICGILSVSRAFGDIKLKTRRREMLEEGVNSGLWTSKFASRIEFNGDWVTAMPDVYLSDLKDCEFVILASDGLWDYVQVSEAVRFVKNQLREHGNAQQACEALANMALVRNGQDNVSVIIADFGVVQQQPNVPFEDRNIVEDVGQLILTLGIVGLGIWLSQFASHGLI